MPKSYRVFDPNGDVYLIMNPKSEAIVNWNVAPDNSTEESLLSNASHLSSSHLELQSNDGSKCLDDPQAGDISENDSKADDVKRTWQYKYKVSSRHLILASGYFRRMLLGPWKEAQRYNHRSKSIPVASCDREAFKVFLRAIHGLHRHIPRSVSVDVLAEIAVLVDFYECHDAFVILADMWIQALPSWNATTHKEILQLLCIASVFEDQDKLNDAIFFALRQGKSPFGASGVPIPHAVTTGIDKKRETAIESTFVRLQKQLEEFSRVPASSHFERQAILYGSFMMETSRLNLLPAPEAPFLGIDWEGLVRRVKEIRKPMFCTHNLGRCRECRYSDCSEGNSQPSSDQLVQDLDQDMHTIDYKLE